MKRLLQAAALSLVLMDGAPLLAQTPQDVTGKEIEALVASGGVSGALVASAGFLARFYALRDNAPAWYGTPAAGDLLAELDAVTAQGFLPADFHTAELIALYEAAREEGTPAQIAAFDLLASDAAIRLVHHMVYGKVDPRTLDAVWNFDRPVIARDPAETLQAFLSGPGFAALMDELAIENFQYLQLVDALARYRQIAAAGGWGVVPDGPTLKPDMTDARVPALRARLLAEGGYLSDDFEEGDINVYGAELVAAVQRFQRRHGLAVDGAIGPATRAALNRPPADRIDQIRLSLERFRWYVRELKEDFVLVNIAGPRVFVVLDGRLAWATRAITGTEYRQTPIFADEIEYMVLNPTWSVPASILRKDKLPKIRQDRSYLERNGYVVRNAAGKVIPAGSVNWSADSPGVSLMQKPGPDNALGLVKFMFPNDYAVYLHDTNARHLFDQDVRTLSSGCVRIEDPFTLAGLLMRDDPSWTQERMQMILDSGKTTRVDLPRLMPVMLTYWTAWVEDDVVQFREDPYERDPRLLEALNALP